MVLRSGCAHWVSFWGVVAHVVKVVRVVGDGVAVGVCAMGVVLGVVAHGVKVAGVVGDGVEVVVRRWCCSGVADHGTSCSDRGEGVAVCVVCLLIAY